MRLVKLAGVVVIKSNLSNRDYSFAYIQFVTDVREHCLMQYIQLLLPVVRYVLRMQSQHGIAESAPAAADIKYSFYRRFVHSGNNDGFYPSVFLALKHFVAVGCVCFFIYMAMAVNHKSFVF